VLLRLLEGAFAFSKRLRPKTRRGCVAGVSLAGRKPKKARVSCSIVTRRRRYVVFDFLRRRLSTTCACFVTQRVTEEAQGHDHPKGERKKAQQFFFARKGYAQKKIAVRATKSKGFFFRACMQGTRAKHKIKLLTACMLTLRVRCMIKLLTAC